jgi:hypothetical protein
LKSRNTRSFEVGTELKFLNNRVGIDYTFSRQNVVDQIFEVSLAGSTGVAQLVIELSEVQIGDVVITSDPNDQYTIFVSGLARLDGLNEDRGPLVMHINPSSFKVTADKKVVATSAFGYHNLAYTGTGTFNSCYG